MGDSYPSKDPAIGDITTASVTTNIKFIKFEEII
jgi:hypothetical protein